MVKKENGFIEIKNGLVKVYDPMENGLPVIIEPDPLAEIKVNDKLLETKQAVASADKIEIIPLEEEIKGTVTIKLSDDALQAIAVITPRITIKRRIADSLKVQELVLAYEEEKTESLDITVEDVEAALKEKGVTFGIDNLEIEKAVRAADGQPYVIAQGEKPVEGRDGYVELFFDQGIKISSYDEESMEKVDFKEKIVIPSVDEGDLLAVVHPPVPGTPGYSVTGKVLEPQPVYEPSINCKEGCILKDNQVLATEPGRPLAEGKHHDTLRVLQVYTHRGDVDLKSGNLRFGGELEIIGNIMEGMTVQNQGNLQVMGHTAGAQIIVGGSAVFQNNLVNSKVTAGAVKGFYQKIIPHISEMVKALNSLREGLGQLQETLSNRGREVSDRQVGSLVKLLVDRRFETLPKLAENMLAILKESRFSPPSFFDNAIKEVGVIFKDFTRIQNRDHFEQIVDDIQNAAAYAEHAQEMQVDIIANYTQNSDLECSGNITVKGTGSYNTVFNAGGNVHIEGIFRGGEIKAQGDVFIGEAGSPGLVLKQGNIILATDSTARFRKVYENARVFFGKRGFKFTETRTMVKVLYAIEEDVIKILNI